jgi:hypothetical protein
VDELGEMGEPTVTETPIDLFSGYEYSYMDTSIDTPCVDDALEAQNIKEYLQIIDIPVDAIGKKSLYKFFQAYCILHNKPIIDKINFRHYMHILGYCAKYDKDLDKMVYFEIPKNPTSDIIYS